ncbi:cupin domain-containing protein [Albibacillus kandeliae]|uniref:cupin domain-containing protein n=1 Tax=Albibacillus kandeliae TaxID=2174228 RepID=UPI000D69D56F|nr:cupin domain-containing protein [Albibacillus kandeliae]
MLKNSLPGHAPAPAENLGQVMVLGPNEGKTFWQPTPANGQISVKIAPAFVDLQTPFSLGTQTVAPNSYVREHSHPEHDEVIHVISGHGRAVVEGQEYEMLPDTTIFVGRNRRHMFINTQQDTDLHWVWFIQPNGLEDFFEQVGRPVEIGQPDPTPFPRPDDVLEIERRTAFAPQPADQRSPD